MSSFTYTFTLNDIGLGSIASASPVVRIRPVVEAFGPDGIVSARPRTITLSSGVGTVTLYPSGELTPANGGKAGVDYIIEVARFEEALDGVVFEGVDVYRFTAVAGGGNVGDMAGGSLLAVWVGPPWPSPLQKGLYIDLTPPNDWGIRA